MVNLFSPRERTDVGPSRHGEPHIDYLDRTARQSFVAVRLQMQQWLDAVPARHRRDLAARLRSRDDHHFEAAFFELYLHALFKGIGLGVTLHPAAGNRGARPDFCISQDSGQSVLVEAATVDERSAEGRAAWKRLVAIYDSLNDLPCPDYFFHVEHFGEPATPIPLRALNRTVAAFVASLSYEAVCGVAATRGLEGVPGVTFDHGGCSIRVSVLPVSGGKRGSPDHRPVGITGAGAARIVDDRTPIRDKIRAKARKYGAVRQPMIIAVNAAGRHLDKIDIMEALFGRETFTMPRGPEGELLEPVMTRQPNGVWNGPRGPQNRRVSAVLLVSSLVPWTVAVHEPVLYRNPWARYPLAEAILPLETYGPVEDQMLPAAGRPAHELLKLPERWPFHLAESD